MAKLVLNWKGKSAERDARRKNPLAKHYWPQLNDDALLFGQRIEKLTEGPHAGCWVVRGCDPNDLPPKFVWGGASRSAAYISFDITIGGIQDWEYVIPRCGTRGCINVNHLILRDRAGMRSFYSTRSHESRRKDQQERSRERQLAHLRKCNERDERKSAEIDSSNVEG